MERSIAVWAKVFFKPHHPFLSHLAQEVLANVLLYLKSEDIYLLRSTGDTTLWWKILKVLNHLSVRSNNLALIAQTRPFVRCLKLTYHKSSLQTTHIFSVSSPFERLTRLSIPYEHFTQLGENALSQENCPSLVELEVTSAENNKLPITWFGDQFLVNIKPIKSLKAFKMRNITTRTTTKYLADLLSPYIETLELNHFIFAIDYHNNKIALLPQSITCLSLTIGEVKHSCCDFSCLPLLQSLTIRADAISSSERKLVCNHRDSTCVISSNFHLVLPPSLESFSFSSWLDVNEYNETPLLLQCLRAQCPNLKHLRLDDSWSTMQMGDSNDASTLTFTDLLPPNLITCRISKKLSTAVCTYLRDIGNMGSTDSRWNAMRKLVSKLPSIHTNVGGQNIQHIGLFQRYHELHNNWKSLTTIDFKLATHKLSSDFRTIPPTVTKLKISNSILDAMMTPGTNDSPCGLAKATFLKHLSVSPAVSGATDPSAEKMCQLLKCLPSSLKSLKFFRLHATARLEFSSYSWRELLTTLGRVCPKLKSLRMRNYIISREDIAGFSRRLGTLEFTLFVPLNAIWSTAGSTFAQTCSLSSLPFFARRVAIYNWHNENIILTDVPPHIQFWKSKCPHLTWPTMTGE